MTCDRLAKDTKVLDMHVTNVENVVVSLSNTFGRDGVEGLKLDIPRHNGTRHGVDSK